MRKILCAVAFLWCSAAAAKPADIYLFYNSASENLNELGISKAEVDKAFDDIYGPASDELPEKIRLQDFFVAKYPDGRYVFILNAAYNCGKLGCVATAYERDADGDLMYSESLTPVKCKNHGSDKLVCIKGGYKVEKKVQKKKRGPVHYPAPAED